MKELLIIEQNKLEEYRDEAANGRPCMENIKNIEKWRQQKKVVEELENTLLQVEQTLDDKGE